MAKKKSTSTRSKLTGISDHVARVIRAEMQDRPAMLEQLSRSLDSTAYQLVLKQVAEITASGWNAMTRVTRDANDVGAAYQLNGTGTSCPLTGHVLAAGSHGHVSNTLYKASANKTANNTFGLEVVADFRDIAPYKVVLFFRHKLMLVPLNDLTMFPGYQRRVNPPRVNRMLMNSNNELSWDLFQFATIGLQQTESTDNVSNDKVMKLGINMVNGGHRTETVRLCYPDGLYPNGDPVLLPVIIAPTRNYAEEALFFTLLNEQVSAVRGIQLFRARIEAGDPVHLDVLRLLRHDLNVLPYYGGVSRLCNHTNALVSFLTGYRKLGVARFREMLRILSIYHMPNDPGFIEYEALRPEFVRGMWRFLLTTTKSMNAVYTKLIKPAAIPAACVGAGAAVRRWSAADIINRARMLNKTSGGGRDQHVQTVLATLTV